MLLSWGSPETTSSASLAAPPGTRCMRPSSSQEEDRIVILSERIWNSLWSLISLIKKLILAD
jgi:hypothetical protein